MGFYVYKYCHPLIPWLYVGKCNANLKDRISRHESDPTDNIDRKHLNVLKASKIYFMEFESEEQTAIVERYLINTYCPKLNVRKEAQNIKDQNTALDLLFRQGRKWQYFTHDTLQFRVRLSSRFIKYTSYTFTQVEQRVFMYILYLVEQDKFKYHDEVGMLTLQFNLKDYVNYISNSRGGNTKRNAVNALFQLACKMIPYTAPNGCETTIKGIIEAPKIAPDGIVSVAITPDFSAFCNLTTKIEYNSKYVYSFTRKYSARLYEYLLASKEPGEQEWTVDVDNFADVSVWDILGIKQHIIAQPLIDSINEITAKSDISVKVCMRGVAGISLMCEEKGRLVLNG